MNYIEMLKKTAMSNPEHLQALKEKLVKEEQEKPYYVVQQPNGDFLLFTGIRFTSKAIDVDDSVSSRHNWSIFHRMAGAAYIDTLYEKTVEHMSPGVWEKKTFTDKLDKESVIDAFVKNIDRVLHGDLRELLPDQEPNDKDSVVNSSDLFVEISLAATMDEGLCTDVIVKTGVYRWVSKDASDGLYRLEIGNSALLHLNDGRTLTQDEFEKE